MYNKVVVRFADGRVLRGSTADFLPDRPVFHLQPAPPDARKSVEIAMQELKALFFVKDLTGDSARADAPDVSRVAPAMGRKLRVTFKDGEVMLGTAQSYGPARQGFFLVPADPGSNNERCYIVAAAVKSVTPL